MKLINFEGMAIFGPGSEWFWAMVTMIAVTVTFFAIYRQLRAQRAANAFIEIKSLDSEWSSERFLRIRLALGIHLRAGDPLEAVQPFLTHVASFFGDLAFLQQHGHIDTEYVWAGWGFQIQRWWTLLAPSIEQIRAEQDDPSTYVEFERLAKLMQAIDMKRGVATRAHDPELVPATLDRGIASIIALLRLELDARAGVIPAPLDPPVG